MSIVKVSVLIITYNQEKYIRDAVYSVLSQITSFPVEVLIGNDCSTDETETVLKEIIDNTHTNFSVKVYNREKNLGASLNIYELIREARGEYITILEGDDYWVGTNKLEKLVYFLDNNSDYIGISHVRNRVLDNIKIGSDPDNDLLDKEFNLSDYSAGKQFSAMATLYRNFYCGMSEEEYKPLFMAAKNACDLVLCYNILKHGTIFIIHDVFGVYKVSSGNNYNSKNNQIQSANDYLKQIEALNKCYDSQEELTYYEMLFLKQKSTAIFKQNGLLKWINYVIVDVPRGYKFKIISGFCKSVTDHCRRKMKKKDG